MGEGHPKAGQPDKPLVPGERRRGDTLLEFHRGGPRDDQHRTKVGTIVEVVMDLQL